MRLKFSLGAVALLVGLVAASASGDGGAQQDVAICLRSDLPPGDCGSSRLDVEFRGEVTPRQLPRRGFAPVAATIGGTIATESGGHPSALREAAVSLDEGIRIDTKGLAVCARRRLENLDMAGARRACRAAIVGHGVARVGLSSSGAVLRTPLTLFNGGTSGDLTRLFVHGAAGATDGALVAVAQVQRRENGLEATWRVPRILEGDGSLLGFTLQIKRMFMASGRRHSYLSGHCPDGVMKVSFPKLRFVNETHVPGVPAQTLLKGRLAVPCVPKR